MQPLNGIRSLHSLTRMALQQFYNQPKIWLSLITCLAMALAVLIFSVQLLNQIMYSPLPFKDAEHRFALSVQQGPFKLSGSNALYPNVLQALYQQQSVVEVSTMETNITYWHPNELQSLQVQKRIISDNFFQQWPVKVLLGELQSFDHQAVVIDKEFWQVHLQQDPSIIGQLIQLDDQWFTVIAVIDSSTTPVTQPIKKIRQSLTTVGAVWQLQPFAQVENAEQRKLLATELFLKTQLSNTALEAHFEDFTKQLNSRHSAGDHVRLDVISLRQLLWGAWYWFAPMMLLAAVLLCLIALSAVANLTLAHGSTELRRISLCHVLGAESWQISWMQAVQVVVAGLMTMAIAGFLSLDFFTRLLQQNVNLHGLVPSLSIGMFFTGWLVLSLLLWGLLNLPRIKLINQPFAQILTSSGKGSRTQFNLRLMKRLTFVQVFAISSFLLLGSAYLHQNIQRLLPLLAVEHPQLAYFQIRQFQPADLSQGEQAQLIETVRQQLLKTGAIEQVGLLNADPLGLSYNLSACIIEDKNLMLASSAVTENVFSLLNFPVLAGQLPESLLPGEVVINSDAARLLFGAENPIGKKLPCKGRLGEQLVVAVVETSRVLDENLSEVMSNDQGVIFNPLAWHSRPLSPSDRATFLVRYKSNIPYTEVQQIMAQHQHRAYFEPLKSLNLQVNLQRSELITGALVALFVSAATVAVAIYSLFGCLSYQASLRQHQIAVNQCLGMKPSALLILLWRDNLASVLTALGSACLLTALLDWLFGGQAVSMLPGLFCAVMVMLIYSISAVYPCWKTLNKTNLRSLLY